MKRNPMKPIPISAARDIARKYGYDQVVVYARRVDESRIDDFYPGGEHMTTYGVNRLHCDVAARMGETLKRFMGWKIDS